MPPNENAVIDIEQQRIEAQEANDKADCDLAEVRRIRSESQEIHKQVKRTLKENHFADLMLRALENR